ncbi:46123_t:CDS:2, partial [Gigaspora margarita]
VFSLDALNPLRDVTILEGPHLNQFIHPLIDNTLWIFASINYISGEISLQGKAKVMVDGVGYLNDVSNYQRQIYTEAFEYMVQLLVKPNSPLQCCLPKDWVDMPNFVFMYEALIKWA